MARGRFISKSIIADRGVHELSSDTCRLAFTWLITTADKEGRTVGEPSLLLALLFPRRIDVTPEMMGGYIQEWVSAGFVVVYEASDGDRYLQFINFAKHQVGLRKEREPQSDYESPDDCRIIAGKMRVNVNDNENDNDNGNGNEKSEVSAAPNVFTVYESEIGFITSHIAEMLKADIDDYSEAWVIDAIKVSSAANVRSMSYIEAILKRWKAEGKDDGKKKQTRKSKVKTSGDLEKSWGSVAQ